jgi:hypothetical protein
MNHDKREQAGECQGSDNLKESASQDRATVRDQKNEQTVGDIQE